MNSTRTRRTNGLRHRLAATALAATALAGSAGALAACGSTSTPNAAPDATLAPATDATSGAATPQAGADQVLPVDTNPIPNTSTAEGFTIDSVLVENNVDDAGAAVADHLEIAVTNTSTTELVGFEVFTTYADPATNVAESYYTMLPDTFTVAPGSSRIIHFDDTGTIDHFPVNAFSLYATDANALDVTVEVSATDAAPQTATAAKDAGGAEVPD